MSAEPILDLNEVRRRFNRVFEPDEARPPEPETTELQWPIPDPRAFYGLAGDIARALDPTTEADPIGILVTLLTMFGCSVNRSPHIMVGDDRHGANLFATLVGDTSGGRKGTSLSGPRRIMQLTDPVCVDQRFQGGLSTGEGMIWAIRDPITTIDKKTGEETVIDQGISDKRLFLNEEEFSFILKVAQRQGNTVSEIIRRAWDSRDRLRIMTKMSPASASGAHVSFLTHITSEELVRTITETDMVNGLANRFAWFRVRRSKFLSNPVRMPEEQAIELARRLKEAHSQAVRSSEFKRDKEASDMWDAVYPSLTTGRPGISGALTARAAPIVLRMSLIYALLDCSREIRAPHLTAALALWDYSDASVRGIFGDLTGDSVADRIKGALETEGEMSRQDISDLFGRNVSSTRIGQALELLQSDKRVSSRKVFPEGKGRPTTFYFVERDMANAS